MGMNFQLLYRVLKSDYLKQSKTNVKNLQQSSGILSEVSLNQKLGNCAGPSVQNGKTSSPTYEAELLLPIPSGSGVKLD